MSMSATVVRSGIRRGLIEFRNSLTVFSEVGFYLVGFVIFAATLVLMRDLEFIGGASVAAIVVPATLAMVLMFVAAYGVATVVTTDREDGGLLRSKSAPHGMAGYVIGAVVRGTIETAFAALVISIIATIILPGLWSEGPLAILQVVGIIALGTVALIPIGLAIGSLFRNSRAVGTWGFFAVGALAGVSGLFVTMTAMPVALQVIGQIFPLYWLALGLRSAILPDAAAVIEIGESWRTLETLGVLGVWAIIGLVLAPILLRRMARRESGSSVAAGREAAMKRV